MINLRIVLISALLFAFQACAHGSNGPSQSTKPPTPAPLVEPAAGATGKTATGLQAVQLTNGQITKAQVRDYALSHPVPRALSTENVSIDAVVHLENQKVSSLLGTPMISVAPSEPMWVVILKGHFTFPGPPGRLATFPVAVEVFDAKSGRLMQFGGLPQPPSTVSGGETGG